MTDLNPPDEIYSHTEYVVEFEWESIDKQPRFPTPVEYHKGRMAAWRLLIISGVNQHTITIDGHGAWLLDDGTVSADPDDRCKFIGAELKHLSAELAGILLQAWRAQSDPRLDADDWPRLVDIAERVAARRADNHQ